VAVFGPFTIDVPRPLVKIFRHVLYRARIISKHEATGRWHIELTYASFPVVAVLFLLAVTAIGRETIRKGIVGAEGIHPLDIMALFISLVELQFYSTTIQSEDIRKAYIVLSLEATGLLRFLAHWVARKAGTSGRRVYAYLYAFFFASGVIIGNVDEFTSIILSFYTICAAGSRRDIWDGFLSLSHQDY
jgi:hypothetical protein